MCCKNFVQLFVRSSLQKLFVYCSVRPIVGCPFTIYCSLSTVQFFLSQNLLHLIFRGQWTVDKNCKFVSRSRGYSSTLFSHKNKTYEPRKTMKKNTTNGSNINPVPKKRKWDLYYKINISFTNFSLKKFSMQIIRGVVFYLWKI